MEGARSHLPSDILLFLSVLFSAMAFGSTESWAKAVLAALLTLLFFLRYLSFGRPGLLWPRNPPVLWAYLLLLAFGAAQATNPSPPLSLMLAGGPLTASRHLTLNWLFDFGLFAACIALLPACLGSAASRTRFAAGLLVAGALVALVGIAQQQAGNTHYFGIRPVSAFRVPFGPFPNKNHAGTFLAFAALAGAGLLAGQLEHARAGAQPARKLDEFLAKLGILASLEFLVLLGLLKTHSRGALASCFMAGALAAAAYAARSSRSARRLIAAAALGGIAATAAIAWRFSVPLASLLPVSGENSITVRAAMIGDGLAVVRDFPLGGVGLGALRAAYPLWKSAALKDYYVDHLHCDPLELAAEAGLPLALVFYLAAAATFVLALRALLAQTDAAVGVPLAMLAAAGAFFIHQALDFPAQIPSLHVSALAALAASWAAAFPPAPAPPAAPAGRGRRFLGGSLAALSLALCVPRVTAGYFDLLSSRFPQPSKHYYLVHAASVEPSLRRSLALTASNWELAQANPAASRILLRQALRESLAALELEPGNAEVRRATGLVLAALGRRRDAGEFLGQP